MKKYLFLLVLFCISCVKEKQKINYYSSGAISSIFFYNLKDTINPYKVINYFENGRTKDTCFYNSLGNLDGVIYSNILKKGYVKWTSYKNGLKNGENLIIENNNVKITQNYINDVLYGIEKRYDSNGNIIQEALWLNDNAIALKEFSILKKGDTLLSEITTGNKKDYVVSIIEDAANIISYFRLISNKKFLMGSLIINGNGAVNYSDNNSYFSVIKQDTIKQGEFLKVEIKGSFGNLSGVQLYAQIGELNKNFDFESSKYYESTQNSLIINFETSDYEEGYNLLLGKVYLRRDSVTLFEGILFEDFYVLK